MIQVEPMASASESQVSSCLCLSSAETIGTGLAKVSIFLNVGPECDRGLHGLLMTEPETSEPCMHFDIFSVERRVFWQSFSFFLLVETKFVFNLNLP